MKITIPLILAGVAIGFAACWFIKSEAQKPESPSADVPRASSRVATVSQPSAEEPVKPSQRNNKAVANVISSSSKNLTPKQRKIDGRGNKTFEKTRQKRFVDKFETKIADLTKELGLNAEQEKALRAFYSEGLDVTDLKSLMSDPAQIKQTAALLRGDGLNEYMKDHLSAEQLENLNAMQERKSTNKIQSVALNDLAKLQQSLNLSQEQKDSVYNLLMEDAEKSVTAQSDAEIVRNATSGGNVIRLGGSGSTISLGGQRKTKEERQSQIDEQVERMSPVLNESQLTKYREGLEKENRAPSGTIQEMFITPSN